MMKFIGCLLIAVIAVSCKSNYKVTKTNIELNSYTNSKYKEGLIISGFDTDVDFYSLYYAEIKSGYKTKNLQKIKIKNRGNFKHISNGCYVPAAKEFYFTSNNIESGKLELYKSRIENLELVNPMLIELPLEKGSYGHSVFTSDGLSMIICSKDSLKTNLKLYKRKNYLSDWSYKRNLDELNLGDHNFHPTLVNDSLLIYSQKNKKKLHLYYTTLKDSKKWDNPKKVKGLPKSEEKIGFILINDKSGYYTSKKNEKDEIYFFQTRKGIK